jgi:hypothetical protein
MLPEVMLDISFDITSKDCATLSNRECLLWKYILSMKVLCNYKGIVDNIHDTPSKNCVM